MSCDRRPHRWDHDRVGCSDVDDDLRCDRFLRRRLDVDVRGKPPTGPLAHIVVRNWGALIANRRADADLRSVPPTRAPAGAGRRRSQQSNLHRAGFVA